MLCIFGMCRLLIVVCCVLRFVRWMSFDFGADVRCVLRVGCCSLRVVYRVLFVASWLLVVGCSLRIVCWLLFVGCCLVVVVRFLFK